MSERFWISGWDRSAYSLDNAYKQGMKIQVFLTKDNPNQHSSFEVITIKAHREALERLQTDMHIQYTKPVYPMTATRIMLENEEIEERKKQFEKLVKLPDQINRLTDLIVNTTNMINQLNDRLMKLESNWNK